MPLRHQIWAVLLLSCMCISMTFAATEGDTENQYAIRAEIATALLLARTPNVPKIRNTAQYPEIPQGSALEPYLLAAVKFGIISPDAQGRLNIGSTVTRAEFLKMIGQTFGLSQNLPNVYMDVPRDSWYAPYAGIATHYKLFDQTAVRLDPSALVTKREAVEVMRTFLRLWQAEQEAATQKVSLEEALEAAKPKLYSTTSKRRTKAVLVTKPVATSTTTTSIPRPQSLSELRQEILRLVNNIRIKRGLMALQWNEQLETSAQRYADEMAYGHFFGHISPEGRSLRDRMEEVGYYDRSYSAECNCLKGFTLGENLARGQKTPQEAVDAWMNSASHKAAILNPDYKETGIGINAGIWVEHFGGVLLPGQPVLQE